MSRATPAPVVAPARPKPARGSRPSVRSALATLAFAVPAALLALGWFLATLREERARRDQARRDLGAGAEVLAAAVREGLEELRAREDERPYYLYSYYYTPPDLIAVQESVAVSPLGRIPDDTRVRGHFQIDPGAHVGSPLVNDEAPPLARQRGAEVLQLASSQLSPGLADLTRGTGVRNERTAEAVATQLETRLANGNAMNNQVQAQSAYSSAVLRDIRAAQAGQPQAQSRALERGRAPYRERVTVPWRGVDGRYADNDVALDQTVARGDGDDRGPTSSFRRSSVAAPVRVEATDGADSTTAARYTTMAFGHTGALYYLYRVVETDGESSVQGVLLDGAALRGRWLDAVARRHGVAGALLSLVPRAEAARCGAMALLPAPLDELAVCARPRAPRVARPLAWQLAALVTVLALIGASALARARALRRAEELAGIERAFVASVSHELRTPLTTLRMHAEMLQEGWVAEERRERVIGQLVSESARLSRLIEDVLTFGRLADGRAEVRLADGPLGAHVRGIAERERAGLAERGVTLDLAGIDDAAEARYDAAAVDQIVTNLLDNAAKYAADAEPRAIQLAVSRNGPRCVVRVRDHGPGVPAAERERVFERFYRGRDARASHVAGTGLGLAIVRGLARAMGGDAQLTDPGPGERGCVVELSLPAAHFA